MIHFYKTPDFLKKLSGSLVWDIKTQNKEIYLTFDDGPIPKLTNYILDVLDDFDAKATFFCVGENIYKYPEIYKSILDKNHLTGNHTFNHLKGWSTKNDQFFMNIEKCQELIPGTHPIDKPLFRPPHGQITLNQIRHLKEIYKIVMWDVLAYDFSMAHSPEKSLEKVIGKTKAGSIVVFHDNYKAEEKLKYMLPKFLHHFKEKGFSFNKLDLT